MPTSYLESSQLAWEEVGDVTDPRSAGGDQRLRLEQGPGKTDPWLVSTTLGQAEKHLLSLDTLPDSTPHPALTGSRLHTWAGTDPEARNCPQGGQEQIIKGAKSRGHQGPQATGCWPAPAPPPQPPGSKEGGPERLVPSREAEDVRESCLQEGLRSELEPSPGAGYPAPALPLGPSGSTWMTRAPPASLSASVSRFTPLSTCPPPACLCRQTSDVPDPVGTELPHG